MSGLKTVIYRDTGRLNDKLGQPELVPEPIKDTRGLSIFRGGRMENGAWDRFNATGDSPENGAGYYRAIDTLTYIKKQVTEQKFYEFDVEEIVPIAVGDGAFSDDILTWRSFSNSGDFEAGLIRTGASQSRLARSETSVDSVSLNTYIWAKAIDYSIVDIEKALQANNWDIILAKHQARAKDWQLGIQLLALLGSKVDTGLPGFLTGNVGTTDAATTITTFIKLMDAATLATFVATVIGVYFKNTNSTVMPDTFLIPMQDFLGLGTLTPGTVGTFPVPRIEYLTNLFKQTTRNPNFKIIPNAYCDIAVATALRGIAYNMYMLYRKDPTSVRMDIPVWPITTQPGTVNNFQFEDVAFGQLTGVGYYRPLEATKFTHAVSAG
jgi:hypothetical protein